MHRITFWMKAEPLTDPRSMRSERVKSEKVSYCKSYCCCTTADLAQNAHLALHRPVLCAPRPAPGCASPELQHATERRLAVAPGLLPTCGLPSLFTGMKRQTRTGSAPPPHPHPEVLRLDGKEETLCPVPSARPPPGEPSCAPPGSARQPARPQGSAAAAGKTPQPRRR